MAVVKIRKVKATLAKSIAYVTDPAKTDGQRLASTTTEMCIRDRHDIALWPLAWLAGMGRVEADLGVRPPPACHALRLR